MLTANSSSPRKNPIRLAAIHNFYQPFKEHLLFTVAVNFIIKIPQDLNFLTICLVAEAAAKMGII